MAPVFIDFPWKSLFAANQPKFPGCQDLGEAVADQSRKVGKAPILILTTQSEIVFERKVTDRFYVAIVCIRSYLRCMEGKNRSAVFFLSVWEEIQDLLVAGTEALPLRSAQLIRALSDELEEAEEAFINLLDRGNTKLTAKLLSASSRALNRSVSRDDLNSLIDLFDTDSIALIEDVATVVRRERAINEYKEHLEVDDWSEKTWQSFFQREFWIFGHGLLYYFLNIVQREALVGGKSMANTGGQVTDFAMCTVSENARYIALVDIKIPQKKLVQKEEVRNGAHSIHPDLAEAVAQIQSNCNLWVREGSNQIDNLKKSWEEGWQTAQPRGIIVTGHTRSLENEGMRQSFELFRRHLHGIEILTFDELLLKAQALVEHSSR